MRNDIEVTVRGQRRKAEVVTSNHHTVWCLIDWGCVYINDANPVLIKRHRFKHNIKERPW